VHDQHRPVDAVDADVFAAEPDRAVLRADDIGDGT